MKEDFNITYKALFRKYYPNLIFYATRLVGEEEAEDVVQDVFVELWKRKDSMEIGDQIQAFLYRAVYTRSLNVLKHRNIESGYMAIVEEINQKRVEFYQPDNNEVIRRIEDRELKKEIHDEDVQTISVNGKEVIAINVPRADYNLRPVYINNNLMRGTYRRNHEGDYHCTEQMIKMMVRDAYEDGNDRMFLEYYTMDDIDIPTLEGYRVMFKTNNPEHIWNSLDHKEFLMQLGGYVVNRKDGTEGLTIAGLLMFGKGLPVRERFDYLRMDYIDKSNLIGDQRYSDRLTYDGTWGE